MVPSYALLALVHPPLLAHGFDALLLTVREIVPHSPRAQPKKVFNAPTIYMETLTNLSAKLHGSLLGVTIFNLHHQGPLLTFSIYKFCFYLFFPCSPLSQSSQSSYIPSTTKNKNQINDKIILIIHNSPSIPSSSFYLYLLHPLTLFIPSHLLLFLKY
ncbi:hypothetical protein POPTR_010G081351v4 [Populus trichocarpa]|uniref:Uncharacterized protein n=1 Tax=Populus trichocarpa TaxID=3694 RepID=A0ACC0SCK5_POPTR|nr:hypothetical protein POPTR_010G081351v4 [Populus trichocarpa]